MLPLCFCWSTAKPVAHSGGALGGLLSAEPASSHWNGAGGRGVRLLCLKSGHFPNIRSLASEQDIRFSQGLHRGWRSPSREPAPGRWGACVVLYATGQPSLQADLLASWEPGEAVDGGIPLRALQPFPGESSCLGRTKAGVLKPLQSSKNSLMSGSGPCSGTTSASSCSPPTPQMGPQDVCCATMEISVAVQPSLSPVPHVAFGY